MFQGSVLHYILPDWAHPLQQHQSKAELQRQEMTLSHFGI